jgi:DNA invertase Pin-like site-specific DNA recombinase
MAFVGRTSTETLQDPVESLGRQIRRAAERLPQGFYIARYYWDVESGGTDLDARSRTGVWEKFAAAGIPRDGGMAGLRAAIATGNPPFSAVICENIERSGRDMYDALRLEKELRAAGMPVFATDEPIDAQAPEASTILVRRVKQGMAEYFRYNLKAQMWEGLRQYVIGGYNTGRIPYGYLPDRSTHPNPLKASMGATRARLVPDPERGPWVTRMFQWRVYEKLSLSGIARRLTAQGAPSPDGKPWSPATVNGILRNPKYTGKVVIGRTRNAGPSQRKGERKVRAVPREHWTWAGDDHDHPALVSMELWEAAQDTGRQRGSVADHTAPPAVARAYPLRARILCMQCQRRMAAKTYPGRTAGKTYTYYVCPHNPNNPRHAAARPGHIRAAIKEETITAGLAAFMDDYLLGHDRAAMLANILPATAAGQASRDQARADALRKKIAQADTAIGGLIAQLEQLGDSKAPADVAYRDRIRDQFTARYDERTAAETELRQLEQTRPPATDPTLIDELPYAAGLLSQAPDHIKQALYAAFDISCLYRQDKQQVTIRATITDTTPATITALLNDPRTDPAATSPDTAKTFGNPPLAAMAAETPNICP